MTFNELLDSMKACFCAVPTVNSYYNGDVYAVINNSNVNYPVVSAAITQCAVEPPIKTYTFTIYSSDRLKASDDNINYAYESQMDQIEQGLNRLANVDGVLDVSTNRTYQFGSLKTMDVVACSWVTVTVQVRNELSQCEE